MAIELEFKAKVVSHSSLRNRLRGGRAELVTRVLETNIHFDTANRTLCRRGRGIRIRTRRSLAAPRKKMPATITYKGPLKKSRFKSREEIETTIGDPDEMIKFLTALGFREQIRFEKRRESWILPVGPQKAACKVELDAVPSLGSFIEIEAPNERMIHAALSVLGMTHAPPIRESYVAMLAAIHKPRRRPSRPLIFKFD